VGARLDPFGDDGALALHVSITQSRGRFEAPMQLTAADGRPPGERRLEGARACSGFTDSIALAAELSPCAAFAWARACVLAAVGALRLDGNGVSHASGGRCDSRRRCASR